MTEAEIKLRDVAAGDFALKSALAEVAESYDYVILDCPPALSKLTVNALVAADGVLIPMQCEYYALERSEERRVGKSVSVRVDLGGRRLIKKKIELKKKHHMIKG